MAFFSGMLISEYVVMMLQIWHLSFLHILLPLLQYVVVCECFDYM